MQFQKIKDNVTTQGGMPHMGVKLTRSNEKDASKCHTQSEITLSKQQKLGDLISSKNREV